MCIAFVLGCIFYHGYAFSCAPHIANLNIILSFPLLSTFSSVFTISLSLSIQQYSSISITHAHTSIASLVHYTFFFIHPVFFLLFFLVLLCSSCSSTLHIHQRIPASFLSSLCIPSAFTPIFCYHVALTQVSYNLPFTLRDKTYDVCKSNSSLNFFPSSLLLWLLYFLDQPNLLMIYLR